MDDYETMHLLQTEKASFRVLPSSQDEGWAPKQVHPLLQTPRKAKGGKAQSYRSTLDFEGAREVQDKTGGKKSGWNSLSNKELNKKKVD